MTNTDLLRHIRLGDLDSLELDRPLFSGDCVVNPTGTEVADKLAAFANGRGGTLALGVDGKTRAILGIPLARLDAAQGWVMEICNESIEPPLDADIRKIELPDEDGELVPLIRVDVPRSLFVHESPGGYFRRIGNWQRHLSVDGLAHLFQERSPGHSRSIRFDESVVARTSPEHLDDEMTRRFLRDDVAATADALRKLRIVAADPDGSVRLTVAGALLCTPRPQQWLLHAQIRAVSYAGERHDVNYQNDARDLDGPLDVQISEALHFVRRNMLVRATNMTARVETPQFSEHAVFEALVNAVAHRDYSTAGARIRLHLFGNRLELTVPGGLVNTLTPDSLHLRQASRNELIVSLLAHCPAPAGVGHTCFMDRRGNGVPIIVRESRELSGRPAEYTLIGDCELRLVIWAANRLPDRRS